MKKIVHVECPNPCCDIDEGCCLCDYTGALELYEDEVYEFDDITKKHIMLEHAHQKSEELLDKLYSRGKQ